MTRDEEALRDAFLSECWRPVREYHQTAAERANAWSRQQAVNGAGETGPAASTERESA